MIKYSLWAEIKTTIVVFSGMEVVGAIYGVCRKKRDYFSTPGLRPRDQHVYHACVCENRRTMEIFQDGKSRPLVIVRFNPDGYQRTDGRKVPSCWDSTPSQGLPRRTRFDLWGQT